MGILPYDVPENSDKNPVDGIVDDVMVNGVYNVTNAGWLWGNPNLEHVSKQIDETFWQRTNTNKNMGSSSMRGQNPVGMEKCRKWDWRQNSAMSLQHCSETNRHGGKQPERNCLIDTIHQNAHFSWTRNCVWRLGSDARISHEQSSHRSKKQQTFFVSFEQTGFHTIIISNNQHVGDGNSCCPNPPRIPNRPRIDPKQTHNRYEKTFRTRNPEHANAQELDIHLGKNSPIHFSLRFDIMSSATLFNFPPDLKMSVVFHFVSVSNLKNDRWPKKTSLHIEPQTRNSKDILVRFWLSHSEILGNNPHKFIFLHRFNS